MRTFFAMDAFRYGALGFNPAAEMSEDGLEEVDVRLQELKSRLQKVESRLQNVKSMPKGSLGNLEWKYSRLRRLCFPFSVDLAYEQYSCLLGEVGLRLKEESTSQLEEGLSALEERLSALEERLSALEERALEERLSALKERLTAPEERINLRLRNVEESQLLIIQAMSIFGVSLGSDSMEGPKTLLYKGPIKPSKRANEMRDYNKKLSDRLASLCTEHVKNGTLPVFGPVAAAQEEERKHQVTLSERKLRQLVLEMGPNRRGVVLSQHRRRAPLSYQKEFLTLCLRTKFSCMRNSGGLYSSQSCLWSLTFNLSRPDEDSSMLEESQLLNNRAMSISRETLGSGLTKWPKLLLNKGRTEPGDTASNVKTLPMTTEEIRDHYEKELSWLAPIFTENIKRALRPVLGPVVAALEEERKHQDKLLELEEKQLALEIRLKRRGVGRPQRRRRVSSTRRLRPRTRQLGPRLSFPWKR